MRRRRARTSGQGRVWTAQRAVLIRGSHSFISLIHLFHIHTVHAQTTGKNRWAGTRLDSAEGSAQKGGREGEEEAEEEDVTHPFSINPFFQSSPQALAEEAQAQNVSDVLWL